MAELKLPRFMLAAPASGSGKTTLTCADAESVNEQRVENGSI